MKLRIKDSTVGRKVLVSEKCYFRHNIDFDTHPQITVANTPVTAAFEIIWTTTYIMKIYQSWP